MSQSQNNKIISRIVRYAKEGFEAYQEAMMYRVLMDYPGIWDPETLKKESVSKEPESK